MIYFLSVNKRSKRKIGHKKLINVKNRAKEEDGESVHHERHIKQDNNV